MEDEMDGVCKSHWREELGERDDSEDLDIDEI
jgi:hypothetical protein